MKKLLIANRGEIALRIIRTAKKMGIKTVAVYSDVDKNSPYVSFADQAFSLNGNSAQDTYLNTEKIIAIAKKSAAEAIHPGYGFLSENAAFVEELNKNGIIFIGPSAQTIRELGNKDNARILAKKLAIPITQGYDESKQDLSSLKKAANTIGFPLLIKAVGGGGGRGMRLVNNVGELESLLESAAREAQAFFNNPQLILEKYIYPARHLEVQLIGDKYGNVLHLFERDCSMQRRYQKVIEEAPALGISENLRTKLLSAAVKIGEAVQLSSAATVEFLVPTNNPQDEFYFLEVNPRIQVEHPVTEAITGLDIVELQIKSALGEKFSIKQKEIKVSGHAIEARVCAENPLRDFQPSIGEIKNLYLPENKHLRLEHSLSKNCQTTTYYDSLLLKIIATGKNQEEAKTALLKALDQTIITGLETNIFFLKNLLGEYQLKNQYTSFIDENLKSKKLADADSDPLSMAKISLAAHYILSAQKFQQKKDLQYFRETKQLNTPLLKYKINNIYLENQRLNIKLKNFSPENQVYKFEIEQEELSLKLISLSKEYLEIELAKDIYKIYINQQTADENSNLQTNLYLKGFNFEISREILSTDNSKTADSNQIQSTLPGTILEIKFAEGQVVKKGDCLLIFESMKMEHKILSPADGTIDQIRVLKGQNVKKGEILIVIKSN